MIYRTTHILKIKENDYFRAMFSDEFDNYLTEKLNLACRRTIYNTETDEKIERKVRSTSKELSERAQSILRQKTLTVDEEIFVNKLTNEFSWQFVPDVFTKMVTIRGKGKIFRNDDESIRREMELDIRVHVPLFGKKIEEFIVSRMDAWYERVNKSLEEFYQNVYLKKSA
ncbi:MAG: DUF2505 domain-containing protein [Deltaproteobacteria bacterium]|nr:DUF2505 domain-containing protein [Deltaproteobacteria bacterium]